MRQDAIVANCQIFRIINYSCKLNIQFILYETILYLDFPPGLAYELKNYTDTVSAIRGGVSDSKCDYRATADFHIHLEYTI